MLKKKIVVFVFLVFVFFSIIVLFLSRAQGDQRHQAHEYAL